MIKTINIVGAGNVGAHLFRSLHKVCEIKAVYSRDISRATKLADGSVTSVTDDIALLPKVDLMIIAVHDDAIKYIVDQMDHEQAVVHTSGSIGLSVFESFTFSGSLYPLQTFTSGIETVNENFPYLIESKNETFQNTLENFCESSLKTKAIPVNSEKRAKIHLAAVLVNNFYNHLAFESEQILRGVGENLSLLKPLMEEGMSKIFSSDTFVSQTGPARRNDKVVIKKQTESLETKELKELYQLFTKLIQDRFSI